MISVTLLVFFYFGKVLIQNSFVQCICYEKRLRSTLLSKQFFCSGYKPPDINPPKPLTKLYQPREYELQFTVVCFRLST